MGHEAPRREPGNSSAAVSGSEPRLGRPAKLPRDLLLVCRRCHIRLTESVLVVAVRQQRVYWYQRTASRPPGRREGGSRPEAGTGSNRPPGYVLRRRYLASTSRVGVGQQSGSNRTPLGLHRVAEKIGAGHPIGTVFESRRPTGLTWNGKPDGSIAHRILWLEGLEPGLNQGGSVDSHARYIYIHGLADEPTLGRPASRGCVHLAGADLLALFDRLQTGSLVWIGWC